jgi:bifunctional non-homologous end joining protein LigD
MTQGELLTEITVERMLALLNDPNFGGQEKHNGERRLVTKYEGVIRDYNRDGTPGKGLPKALVNSLLKHPLEQFEIEVELVGSTIYVFDALMLAGTSLRNQPYEVREHCCHVTFDKFNRSIIPVTTARTREDKIRLILHLMDTQAEGVCLKNMKATYREGRANQHFKFKFWKSLDAIVIGPSPEGKDSVRVGVFNDKGVLIDICGVSLSGKFRVKPGDVVEVKYLYATATYNVVQPSLLRKRDDKSPMECTTAQMVINKNFLTLAGVQ